MMKKKKASIEATTTFYTRKRFDQLRIQSLPSFTIYLSFNNNTCHGQCMINGPSK